MKLLLQFIILSSLFLLVSCTSSLAPIRTEPATVTPKTTINKDLQSLPLPKEKIVAAVYKFRDQTGQYKLSSTGTSWSTAVTQGATTILMRALEDSKWFMPIEREGLSNLLNERKIIRSSRANYKGANGEELPALPPLLYAGIILEGGIISYESNLITGGVGLKYFGSGVSNQYREDKVTIYLRATSTQNGRVLKTVTTSKTILSQMVDIGIFKYVDFQRLLEVETGFSYNEPVDMCVAEAIEKAVYCLVIEGVKENLWEMAEVNDNTKQLVEKYEKEKDLTAAFDYTEKRIAVKNVLGYGVEVGAILFQNDYSGSTINGYSGLSLLYPLTEQFKLSLSGGWEQLSNPNYFHTNCIQGLARLQYDFAPSNDLNPFFFMGFGLISYSLHQDYGSKNITNSFTGIFNMGLGAEVFVNNLFGINLKLEHNIAFNDNLDGLKHGKWNDTFWSVKAGLNFYPGR